MGPQGATMTNEPVRFSLEDAREWPYLGVVPPEYADVLSLSTRVHSRDDQYHALARSGGVLSDLVRDSLGPVRLELLVTATVESYSLSGSAILEKLGVWGALNLEDIAIPQGRRDITDFVPHAGELSLVGAMSLDAPELLSALRVTLLAEAVCIFILSPSGARSYQILQHAGDYDGDMRLVRAFLDLKPQRDIAVRAYHRFDDPDLDIDVFGHRDSVRSLADKALELGLRSKSTDG